MHTPLLTAAAMVIRLSPKASRPFPAARFRAGTYRERLGAGWRDLWRHLQEWFLASRVPRRRCGFGRHALGSNFWRGAKYGKVDEGRYFLMA